MARHAGELDVLFLFSLLQIREFEPFYQVIPDIFFDNFRLSTLFRAAKLIEGFVL